MKWLHSLAIVASLLLMGPTLAQSQAGGSQPADTMQILREKIKADKKLVVAANMALTEAEAKGFWPVYEAYQSELRKLNEQLAAMVGTYAREYNAGSLTDAKAKQLIDEALSLEAAELDLKRSFVRRLSRVLPGRKVASYLQIGNKIRAIVKYESAAQVPLVP